MKHIAYNRERQTRRISGEVSVSGGTPAIVSGSGFTLTDTGAGQVTVTLQSGGRIILFAGAFPIEATTATGHFAKVIAKSASAVTFGIYAADGTDGVLADNVGFFFEILVKDVAI